MTHWNRKLCSIVLLITGAAVSSAQVRYATGQDVAPAFEGWEKNPDGSFNFVFGYLNRNYEEEVDVPVGPENTIEPGGDRGQPTHFYPRRQRFVFKVVVPNDWDKQRRLVWTLTAHGHTSQAKGWLQPEWELNSGIVSENNGGGALDPSNKAPVITGNSSQTITLPETATLTVSAMDDGLPKPRSRLEVPNSNPPNPNATRREPGLRIKWEYFRGPGKVTFVPDTAPVVYGKPITFTSKVSFSAPGTYVLRAIASDGQLSSTHEVTITVFARGG
jgi:hypothetical protein